MDTSSPAPADPARLPGSPDQVRVTRIGTQVVVRLSGVVGEPLRPRLQDAVAEVDRLAVGRVVVDFDEVLDLQGAGIDFVRALQQRRPVRLLNAPAGLSRGLLVRPAV